MKSRPSLGEARRKEDAKLLQVDYYARLRRDKRARSAFQAIRKRGATDEQIQTLRDQLGMTAACYFCDMWETRSSQQSRRTRLAKRLSETADELEKDVESFGITLRMLCSELGDGDEPARRRKQHGASHKTVVPAESDWTLAACLRKAAAMFLRSNDINSWWQSRFERRVSFQTYAFRSTFLLVAEVLGQRARTRPRPMHIVAKLVSALLDEDIAANLFQRDPLIEEYWPAKRYEKE
jgi:hypothetical protein